MVIFDSRDLPAKLLPRNARHMHVHADPELLYLTRTSGALLPAFYANPTVVVRFETKAKTKTV
jgi:hypothetical protein